MAMAICGPAPFREGKRKERLRPNPRATAPYAKRFAASAIQPTATPTQRPKASRAYRYGPPFRSARPAASQKQSPTSRHTPPIASQAAQESPPALRKTLAGRSEEHTSELQSQFHLVCRLLLE